MTDLRTTIAEALDMADPNRPTDFWRKKRATDAILTAVERYVVEAQIETCNDIKNLIAGFDEDSEAFWGDGHEAVQSMLDDVVAELIAKLNKETDK